MKILQLFTYLFTRRDKLTLVGLLLFSIIVSCIETISISAVMMFISVATNFDYISKSTLCRWAYTILGCSSPVYFVVAMGIGLIIFYFVRGLIGLAHAYLTSRCAQSIYHRCSVILFSHFLKFPYGDFVNNNSAAVGQVIFGHSGAVMHLITSLLTLMSEFFTVACIYGMLFWINWKMTAILTIFLTLQSMAVIKIFSRAIVRIGKRTHDCSLESNKIFNESYGNFKLIKLGDSGALAVDRFSFATHQQSLAQTMYAVLQSSPRFILETIGFVLLVSVMMYVVYYYNNATFIIPMVSMYALAFYRLLPSINKILTSFHQISFHRHAVQGISDFLKRPIELSKFGKVSFAHEICLHNVSFGYSSHDILTEINLIIKRGERVAFVGASGVGKSTLMDLLMGLYSPRSGTMCVDGTLIDDTCRASWQKKIGYIPQTIYLFDGTVAQNVTFGRAFNESKLREVLIRANIYDFLCTQQGFDTRVGEGGVKLSGGQRQRIAIARALYGDPELLVLDEATSALDHDTESCIMDEIYQLARTVTLVIVAHRTSTISRCDKIYKIEQRSVVPITFDRIMQENVVRRAELEH
ncbi:MAG: ATP-binding cassette domain-containing protein [Candidatus Babeliales bacterium]|jgi:ABC-type bacteriocin/lantibiotic exporter with double-glycine peptidase domain